MAWRNLTEVATLFLCNPYRDVRVAYKDPNSPGNEMACRVRSSSLETAPILVDILGIYRGYIGVGEI